MSDRIVNRRESTPAQDQDQESFELVDPVDFVLAALAVLPDAVADLAAEDFAVLIAIAQGHTGQVLAIRSRLIRLARELHDDDGLSAAIEQADQLTRLQRRIRQAMEILDPYVEAAITHLNLDGHAEQTDPPTKPQGGPS